MLKVAAFTGGRVVPSARFRARQYIPALARHGILLREFAAPISSYPPSQKWLRPLWGCAAVAAGLPRIAHSWRYDVTLLQREFISTLSTLEPLTKQPRLLDVDDAIFLLRGGKAARKLAQMSDAVVCGNSFLAEWFRRWNRDVTIVPTAVDTESYVPRAGTARESGPVIGWIGTKGNLRYVEGIETALRRALDAVPGSRLRIVSDMGPELRSLPSERIDFVPWTERGEVAAIQAMDIGIMPLEDSPWARGKCSFKMLQYMACGLPVVISPVGMNAEVLRLGECGIAAYSESQWVDGLVQLLEDEKLRARLGGEGRRIVESAFSIPVIAPRLASCLTRVRP